MSLTIDELIILLVPGDKVVLAVHGNVFPVTSHFTIQRQNQLIFVEFPYFLLFRLTAFVLKVFCQASKFDGVQIDQDLLCRSVDWLVQNQRADGAFPEVRAVIHKEMVVSY